jgi:hypothetical protein
MMVVSRVWEGAYPWDAGDRRMAGEFEQMAHLSVAFARADGISCQTHALGLHSPVRLLT